VVSQVLNGLRVRKLASVEPSDLQVGPLATRVPHLFRSHGLEDRVDVGMQAAAVGPLTISITSVRCSGGSEPEEKEPRFGPDLFVRDRVTSCQPGARCRLDQPLYQEAGFGDRLAHGRKGTTPKCHLEIAAIHTPRLGHLFQREVVIGRVQYPVHGRVVRGEHNSTVLAQHTPNLPECRSPVPDVVQHEGGHDKVEVASSNGSGFARSATTKVALLPTRPFASPSIDGLTSIAVTLAPHPRVIQRRAGHADIRTTMGTYGRVLPQLDEGATTALGDFVFSDNGVHLGSLDAKGGVRLGSSGTDGTAGS
jgi:hypothetical protein